ncbi:MAG: hypothetical protein NTZ68_00750, partial [Candidatus Dependentiae bacterium]|nr:hypothetical protein [Candidatus Dependentiae bacterium]
MNKNIINKSIIWFSFLVIAQDVSASSFSVSSASSARTIPAVEAFQLASSSVTPLEATMPTVLSTQASPVNGLSKDDMEVCVAARSCTVSPMQRSSTAADSDNVSTLHGLLAKPSSSYIQDILNSFAIQREAMAAASNDLFDFGGSANGELACLDAVSTPVSTMIGSGRIGGRVSPIDSLPVSMYPFAGSKPTYADHVQGFFSALSVCLLENRID